jgi:hypothetical protein
MSFYLIDKNYMASLRLISTSRLNTLLCLHLKPINVVIFNEPYFPEGKRNLILKRVSRLDAFSAYLNRT